MLVVTRVELNISCEMPGSQSFLRQRKANGSGQSKHNKSSGGTDSDKTESGNAQAPQSGGSDDQVVWGKTPDGKGEGTLELTFQL